MLTQNIRWLVLGAGLLVVACGGDEGNGGIRSLKPVGTRDAGPRGADESADAGVLSPSTPTGLNTPDAGPVLAPPDRGTQTTRPTADAGAIRPTPTPTTPTQPESFPPDDTVCEADDEDSTCAACWKAECCAELAACVDTECPELLECTANCSGDSACVRSCEQRYSRTDVATLTEFLECAGASCRSACSSDS